MAYDPSLKSAPGGGERGPFLNYFFAENSLQNVGVFLGKRMRRRIFEYFLQSIQPAPDMRVVDLGPTPYMSAADLSPSSAQTPNTNYFEFYYPYKTQITAASIEDVKFLEAVFPGVKTLRIPRGPFPFKDNQFDVVFCSAVLEHVGDRDAQRAFVRECVRIARAFFITTPNRWFPVEAHTFLPLLHWLPQKWHQALLRGLKQPFLADINNLNLLSSRSARALFPAESNVRVKNFYLFGFPQNIVLWGKKT